MLSGFELYPRRVPLKTGRSGKNVTYTRDISCKMKASLAHNKNIFAKTFPIVY